MARLEASVMCVGMCVLMCIRGSAPAMGVELCYTSVFLCVSTEDTS